MAGLLEMKQQRQHALNKADAIVKAAENASRELTPAESLDFEMAMSAAKALGPKIAAIASYFSSPRYIPRTIELFGD